ncbi:MAG: hypothetical protein KGI04_00575 [Candidatus Micrarchaeota archaeon]|nr:hypothetical protein [Candidatus Micrarchaeota archaeon]
MFEAFAKLSLGTLLEKLHGSLKTFANQVEGVVEQNKSMSLEEIGELREHVQRRLSSNEEVEDNKKILNLLELFSTDKAVLEVIRKNSGEWLRLLDAIEGNLVAKGGSLTEEEKAEILDIRELTEEVRASLKR